MRAIADGQLEEQGFPSSRARHKDAKIFYFEQEPDVEEQKAKLINI